MSRPVPRTLVHASYGGGSPAALWAEVLTARAALAAERSRPNGWTAATDARADLLRALETYAATLLARHRPIPYALRDEIRLRQRLSPQVQRHASLQPPTR